MNQLSESPTLFRATLTRSSDLKVEREGGKYDSGVIRNFSVITVGEALGHEAWVDADFITQVAAQLSFASRNKGIKSRYTHPGMSADGLSRGLGRVIYTASEDGKVFGDLHFYKSAHKTPDGDLAGFVMDLTSDDPEALGASISFLRDIDAEAKFARDNPESPDEDNVNNYVHVRLKDLKFVDIVDEPAANPDGMFHQDDIFTDAERLFEYALGLSDVNPGLTPLGIDPARLEGFVSRFLSQRSLELMKVNIKDETPQEDIDLAMLDNVDINEQPAFEAEDAPEAEAPEAEAPEAEAVEVEPVAEEAPAEPVDENPQGDGHSSPTSTRGAYQAEMKKFVESFGKDLGVEYFMADMDYATAQGEYIKAQSNIIKSLKNKLEVAEQTEPQPLSHSYAGQPSEKKGFVSKIDASHIN